MDFVCYENRKSGRFIDFTDQIDDALYGQWRREHPFQQGEEELTSVLFFGVTCSIAELGYNLKGIKRRQVNLCILSHILSTAGAETPLRP